MMNEHQDFPPDRSAVSMGAGAVLVLAFEIWNSASLAQKTIWSIPVIVLALVGANWGYQMLPFIKSRAEKKARWHELPAQIRSPSDSSVELGNETELQCPMFLPDQIRTRHVHILGATGSGKSESVILNFLRQDVERGIGAIILDAKGDDSFIEDIKSFVPEHRLRILDLGGQSEHGYDPLCDGEPLEACQRLFGSLTWSETYYQSKAYAALQRLFINHHAKSGTNPTLLDLAGYLAKADEFAASVQDQDYSTAQAVKDYQDLSGLCDQVRSLTIGSLARFLSPDLNHAVSLESARTGSVLYFRLQSLISPKATAITGKLLINHLNYIAGTTHRNKVTEKDVKLVSIYLDEFAAFACNEFADLISKARSARFGLHFAHQSMGDLTDVSPGFINRITDNSATKIILRINDPDTAEFFSRSFGTRRYHKMTHRVSNLKDTKQFEIEGEGSVREAHQFRAPPDLLKSLPTGQAAVLIAHGENLELGATSVLRIQFPKFIRRKVK